MARSLKQAREIIDKLDLDKRPVKLTVSLIAQYLSKGVSQTEIAKICNVSRQAVNSYITSHSNELSPLVNDKDRLAIKSKLLAIQAMDNLEQCLDQPVQQKYMTSYNIIAGTMIDKYQSLTGQGVQPLTNVNLLVQLLTGNTDKS